jgi:hypothetical protein
MSWEASLRLPAQHTHFVTVVVEGAEQQCVGAPREGWRETPIK